MDPRVVITGSGSVSFGARETFCCDPLPWLKVRKTRKFMGKQDDLAVVAAGRALEAAGLAPADLGEEAGLYIAVGYIPFERKDIERLVTHSCIEGEIDMGAFSTRGMRAVHPLQTFRCLPNMPAYHISANFDVQGPYAVSYPGPGQLYMALEQAVVALRAGRVSVAILAGVADQRNFLVESLAMRMGFPVPEGRLCDSAGVVILETEAGALLRGAAIKGRLEALEASYIPHDPFEEAIRPQQRCVCERGRPPELDGDHGPAALPLLLDRALAGGIVGSLEHQMTSRDGISAASTWVLP